MYAQKKKGAAGFVAAGTGYIKAITALLDEPLDGGDVMFGIEIAPKDGSDSKYIDGIHFDSTIDATSGHVTFDEFDTPETSSSVSPGDVVKFTVTTSSDDKVRPNDNTVSLVAHIAQKF